MTTIRSVILVLALLTASATRAEILILQNDSYTDGGSITCNHAVADDYILAAKFTAPPAAYPYTITKIHVLTCEPPPALQGLFYVFLWLDDGGVNPGPYLWSSADPYTIGGAQVEFSIIDLSGEPIPPPPITFGTIRVGLYAVIADVGFGLDANGITPQTNLVMLSNGTWSYTENAPLGLTGDWIIRVEVEADPTAVGDGPSSGFALEQNVPNPFNPATTIRYRVPVDGTQVTISVYDAVGRRVRTLVDERRPAGSGSVVWNGVDERGASAASGVYFYRMQAGSYDRTRKMVMLK